MKTNKNKEWENVNAWDKTNKNTYQIEVKSTIVST